MNNKLFIFPHAGGFAHQYLTIKRDIESSGIISVDILELSGRGNREPLFDNIYDVVDYLYINNLNEFKRFSNINFLGHSLGGIIAYLLALKIDKELSKSVKNLFISSINPPHQKRESIATFSKDKLIDKMVNYGLMSKTVLENREFFDFLEPILRADFAILDSVNFEKIVIKDFKCSIFYGDSDANIDLNLLKEWQNYFKIVEFYKFSGGHFYLFDNSNKLSELIINKCV